MTAITYEKLQRFLIEVRDNLEPHPQMEHVPISDRFELHLVLTTLETAQISVIKSTSGYFLRMPTLSGGSKNKNGFTTSKIYIDRNKRPYIRVFNSGKMVDIFLSPR